MRIRSDAACPVQAWTPPWVSGSWRRMARGVGCGVGMVIGMVGGACWISGAPTGWAAEVPADPRGPGTARMAARLEEVARTARPMANRFLSADQADLLTREMREHPERGQLPAARYQLGEALLNAGRNREALVEFGEVERLMAASGASWSATNRVNLRLNVALAHLREAERLNCLSNHNADSCLLPIRAAGVHRITDPSFRAIGVLTNLLSEFPDNLAARWLLNVASMTVGRHPQGVRAPWLIPESVFASEAAFPRFRDAGPAAGLGVNELSGASVVEDFDGDERLDVLVTSIGLRDPMRFFRNRGDGTFAESTREAGLTGLTGGLHALAGDYDNDGDLDVLVLRGGWMRDEGRHPNSLLMNRGDGTFEDVTEASGMLSFHPTQAAVWFDFDGGRLAGPVHRQRIDSPRDPASVRVVPQPEGTGPSGRLRGSVGCRGWGM
jgi:hypothetical protein